MAKLSEMKANDNLKILVWGDSGNGKTCFATGFPGPIWVADFDNKISSAASFYANSDQLSQIEYDNYAPTDTRGASAERFNIKLAELKKSQPFPYKTIVLDSLTTFSDEAMRYLMRMNPGIKRTETKGALTPALQDYQVSRLFFKQFITEFLNFPCNVVVTAHIQTEKDEMTGEILRSPMMSGKLAHELPIYFSEVYRAFVKDGKYLAQTKSDNKFQCRTQIKGLPSEIPLSYTELAKQR